MKSSGVGKSLAVLLLLSSGYMAAATNSAFAEEIKWQKYMTSAAVVSSIATAISMVGPCSVPVEFSETIAEGKVQLYVNCFGNEDEEATVIVKFNQFSDGFLSPDGFDFAG